VGLVASKIEAAGISTICLSNIPILTASVGVPRVVALEYPFAKTLGFPGDTAGQLEVLRATLGAGSDIQEPGGISHLPFKWPETKAKAQAHPSVPPPIATYLKRHPWHLPKFINREIPG
jgi:hypothetical protein